ncbi:hypothetical protein WG66_009417 [Moniliophthora roreri]|nr:hypothetical protein WG66_009417 [Moniliophthora roreri]
MASYIDQPCKPPCCRKALDQESVLVHYMASISHRLYFSTSWPVLGLQQVAKSAKNKGKPSVSLPTLAMLPAPRVVTFRLAVLLFDPSAGEACGLGAPTLQDAHYTICPRLLQNPTYASCPHQVISHSLPTQKDKIAGNLLAACSSVAGFTAVGSDRDYACHGR